MNTIRNFIRLPIFLGVLLLALQVQAGLQVGDSVKYEVSGRAMGVDLFGVSPLKVATTSIIFHCGNNSYAYMETHTVISEDAEKKVYKVQLDRECPNHKDSSHYDLPYDKVFNYETYLKGCKAAGGTEFTKEYKEKTVPGCFYSLKQLGHYIDVHAADIPFGYIIQSDRGPGGDYEMKFRQED